MQTELVETGTDCLMSRTGRHLFEVRDNVFGWCRRCHENWACCEFCELSGEPLEHYLHPFNHPHIQRSPEHG